jgi:DNA modification methylase
MIDARSNVHIRTNLDLDQFDPLALALAQTDLIPPRALTLLAQDEQRAFPAIAKDAALTRQITRTVRMLPSTHSLLLGDSRSMETVPDESVHLVLTSPPYWTLKQYIGSQGQLGDIEEYEMFLRELDRVWQHVYRVLVPGGRLIVVVGDVCVSRKKYGRHLVFPLHASIQEHCRAIGFDNLAPIIWYKISNASFEAAGNGASFLGKPYEPGGVVKNDIEFILMQRKSGGYRKPSTTVRVLSVLAEADHRVWFQQIWDLKGASTRQHPAPYPLELAERLIRMFSFVGDTVLDPFLGTGTTSLAASLWGRNSIGFEIEPVYHAMAVKRLQKGLGDQLMMSAFEDV